jgi:WD40 repeat protein/ABC-type dipeptide/oligopeptide/nickel transport system ATPase component
MPDDTGDTAPSTQPGQDDTARADQRVINTHGGDYAEGNIYKGTFFTEERAYGVTDLRTENPYLGLRAFTENDRDIFAGRERIVRALVERLSAADGDRLLLIVGASGSGKSSLARAGLLPDLDDQMRSKGQEVLTQVIDHPGRLPGTTLARLFADAERDGESFASKFHLILIDQFEELFSQADPVEREQALSLLAEHAVEVERPLRIIATMRSDFLPQLVADPRFEAVEQRKVVVRAMTEDELQDAIQRPIRVRHPDRQIEPALVKQLASDAASDAAYLPLLQVTLEDLWRGGELRRGTYHGLADAIQRRADAVYTFRDYDGIRQEPRSADEQQAILELFLALVRVSLNEGQSSVRWRRPRAELTQGDPQRERLITELATARLLRTDREIVQEAGRERTVETADIVHEALLTGWPTLKAAIDAKRDHLRHREHFLLALDDWKANERRNDYLLSGVRLAEAEALQHDGESAVLDDVGREFYTQSLQRRETERERQMRRSRRIVVALSFLTVFALIAAGSAFWFGKVAQQREVEARDSAATAVGEQRRADSQAATAVAAQQQSAAEKQRAEKQSLIARSGMLAAQADVAGRSGWPQRALLLALEAVHTTQVGGTTSTATDDQALRNALERLGGYPLLGHTGAILTLALTADGHMLVTGSEDGTARIWDLTAANPKASVYALRGDAGGVSLLALSADGRTLVTGSENSTPRVWDLTAVDPNKTVRVLQGHERTISALALSGDGHVLVTSSVDRTIRVWDLTVPDPSAKVRILPGSEDRAPPLALSNDGRTLVIGKGDNTIWVWDLTSTDPNTSVRILRGGDNGIRVATLSVDGHTLVTASAGEYAQVWDLTITDPNKSVRDLYLGDDGARTIALSTDGGTLAIGSYGDTAWVWNLTNSDPNSTARILRDEGGSIESLALSADGRRLVTGSSGRTARVWDLNSNELISNDPVRILQGHESSIDALVLSADGETLVTGSREASARLWNLSLSESYATTRILQGRGGWASSVSLMSLSEDAQMLVAASSSHAAVWNLSAPDPNASVQVLRGHEGTIQALALSSDKRTLVTGAEDSTIRVWDLSAPDPNASVQVLRGHEGTIWALALSSDGRTLATAGADDSTVRVWDLTASDPNATVRVLRGHLNWIPTLLLSIDGRTLVTGSSDTTVRVWDLTAAEPENSVRVLRGHENLIVALEMSADGRTLVSGSWDNTARVWDLTLPDPNASVRILRGHEFWVTDLALSADGQTLVTGSYDDTARVWDLRIPDPSGTARIIRGGKGNTTPLVMSADGTTLFTGGNALTVLEWALDIRDMIEPACRSIGRNLSLAEWQQYFGNEPYHRICPNLPDGTGVNQSEESTP